MRVAAACSSVLKPTGVSDGPFFHGTIADLQVDDFLTAGHRPNYRPEVVMNHVYFTALVDGAVLAAEIAAELSGTDAVPPALDATNAPHFSPRSRSIHSLPISAPRLFGAE